MIYTRLIILLTIKFSFAMALKSQSDGNVILTLDEFLEIVREHHPVARQAAIEIEYGEAFHLSAKGAFDPLIYGDYSQKTFNGTGYYNINNTTLKIPTWVGVDFYAGYEQTGGVYLNPELTTPAAGLVFAGVSVPISQGLIIDKRRAELKKAQLYRDITETERKLILNDLFLEAGMAYWDWFEAYNVLRVNEEGVELARERLEFVIRSAELGDVATIDTLEASIQLQNREIEVQDARINFIKNTFFLNNYLWKDGIIPLELGENIVPVQVESVEESFIALPGDSEIEVLAERHPAIVQSNLRIDQMEVERRWRREQLKPVVNIKYNFLTEPINDNPFAGLNVNNYRAGLEFAMPLFLRRERGNVRLINLELESSYLDLQRNVLSIKNNSNAALNEFRITENQVGQYTKMVADSEGLLKAERRKFEMGESSIFLVNTRETAFLNAKVKEVSIVAKRNILGMVFRHSLVLLVEE